VAKRTLVRQQTPVEFFREQLATAMEHQRVSTSAFVEYYLVNLLTRALRVGRLVPREPGYDETPLALLYTKALGAVRQERLRLLRTLGDGSLFVSGFFADSLGRKIVGLRYYRRLGAHAYGRLSREGDSKGLGSEVYSELSGRFMEFADLLHEVSETSRLTSHRSVLGLYERWLQTGSPRAAALLAARGLVPVAPPGGRPQ